MSAVLPNLSSLLKTADSFPRLFLSQHCPLLFAAREAQQNGLQSKLVAMLTGSEFQTFIDDIGNSFPAFPGAPPHLQPAGLLNARRDLVLAALGIEPLQHLQQCVTAVQAATSSQPVPQLQAVWGSPSRFQQTELHSRLARHVPNEVQWFTQLAQQFGGWNPALLSTAAAFASIVTTAPAASHTVITHLLFAEQRGRPGMVVRLTLRRYDFDTDAGGGACYPDPLALGYYKSLPDFQAALQQAWFRELGPDTANSTFDVCWSLQCVGDPGVESHDVNLLYHRMALQQPLTGPSAGAAFACAFRALRLREPLDPHIAITADFKQHWLLSDRLLADVGSVPEKLLADLELAGIDEVLTSSDHPLLQKTQPDTDGNRWIQPHRGKLRLYGIADLDACYQRASQHASQSATVKRHLAERAKHLLSTTCTPYVRSSLSTRRRGDPQQQEPPEVLVPLNSEAIQDVLHGRLTGAKRTRLWAESGLGKSSLLIEAEGLIASESGPRIPIRLGAGACSVQDDGSPVRLPLLSEFDWHRPSLLLTELAERLLGDVLTDAKTRDAWIQRAVQRGEVVFLLDSLDQTDGDIKLAKFCQTDGIRHCPILLTARPETLTTKKQGYEAVEWSTLWVDPFDEARIREFWGTAPLLDRLLEQKDWDALRSVPVLLQQMKKLAVNGRLEHLSNREAVYQGTLELLVQHGQDSMTQPLHRAAIQKMLAELAWKTINIESAGKNNGEATFTGELRGSEYAGIASQYADILSQLDQLNLTVRPTYLDELGIRQEQLAWRHFSFCEWFAGLHLAGLSTSEQQAVIAQHADDDRWRWIFRFALSGAQRLEKLQTVTVLAEALLRQGRPFLLWKAVKEDQIRLDEELEQLCRWLVDRDSESWTVDWDRDTSPWADQPTDSRPLFTQRTARILKHMFRTGQAEPWRNRDSRWLHSAWQLVVENLSDPICAEIHTGFLGEFETRVRAAAERNRSRFRKAWLTDDQGLLQLLPDDVLLDLGVLPSNTSDGRPTQQVLQQWPSPDSGTYEARRDKFNHDLHSLQANYCLCPPKGWEHPYPGKNSKSRDPRECKVTATELRRGRDGVWLSDQTAVHHLPTAYQMQRTPVTNLQFEAFDPLHRRFRRWEWYRPEMETEGRKLDDHPAVGITPYQADMLAIWMTGHGTFGTFRLPLEEDWEACCRGGRDGTRDEFGIPWCDDQQRPIRDKAGHEQYDSLSSYGANFDGGYPAGQAEKGPDLNGTVPTDRCPANGFGLCDMHGQVWEWMDNEYGGQQREKRKMAADNADRCVRGGSWYSDARGSRCSNRNRIVDRDNSTGIRLSRTK